MSEPATPKRDPLQPFLPRCWPDRLLALVVILLVLIFGAALALGGWGWYAVDGADRITKHALLHGGVAIILFCLLEIVWLLFTPPWVERLLRRHTLMALLALALFLPAIVTYLIYYMFLA